MSQIHSDMPNADQNPSGGEDGVAKAQAIASIVLGVLSCVGFCCWCAALPVGVVGIILGAVSMKTYYRTLGTIGFVISIVGTILAVLWGAFNMYVTVTQTPEEKAAQEQMWREIFGADSQDGSTDDWDFDESDFDLPDGSFEDMQSGGEDSGPAIEDGGSFITPEPDAPAE